MQRTDMTRIVNRLRYSTETADIIASDCFWDGHNWERQCRNTWLYRTPKGAFFTQTRTMWQGEKDRLDPVTLEEAISLYEGRLTVHQVDYGQAFPQAEVEDA